MLKQEENQGQLASMLRGLKEAKGQFVSFVDSDDILMPEYAQKHIKTHLETSVAFTSCRIIEIGETMKFTLLIPLHHLNAMILKP